MNLQDAMTQSLDYVRDFGTEGPDSDMEKMLLYIKEYRNIFSSQTIEPDKLSKHKDLFMAVFNLLDTVQEKFSSQAA